MSIKFIRVKTTHVSSFLMVATLAFFIFSLEACSGYKLGSEMPNILGDGTKTLKFKDVDYPTLDAWLPYSLRSSIRDEIAARRIATWVDSGHADYEISIKVVSFTSREWVRSKIDQTLLFETKMVIEATVYDGLTNNEIWHSGEIDSSERQEEQSSKSSSDEIITQISRMLADRLRNAF